jgi:hypothetical protein
MASRLLVKMPQIHRGFWPGRLCDSVTSNSWPATLHGHRHYRRLQCTTTTCTAKFYFTFCIVVVRCVFFNCVIKTWASVRMLNSQRSIRCRILTHQLSADAFRGLSFGGFPHEADLFHCVIFGATVIVHCRQLTAYSE